MPRMTAPRTRPGGGVRTRDELSCAARARPIRASIALVLLITQLAGCYHYAPVASSAVPVGGQVSVSLTDRGRVALVEAVGPGARNVEGQLLERTDTSVILAVSSVRYFDLGIANWAGERVEIGTAHISELGQRRLSRTRTWIAAALIAGGVVLASMLAITGFGSDDGPDGPGGGGDGDQ
jgi:hypothetical protein